MSVFSGIPVPKKGRTNFNESHSVSGNFPLSHLCPVFMTETIPGDRWKINTFNVTKLETLIAPAMQQVDASLLWFKCPKRLVFKHFKKWYSGGTNGMDDHEKPHIHLYKFFSDILAYITSQNLGAYQWDFIRTFFGAGSLWQYMGLPVPLKYNQQAGSWDVIQTLNDIDEENNSSDPNSDFIDLIPLMTYAMIYDCYFRDQTLCEPIFVDAEEGDLTINTGYAQGVSWYSQNGKRTLNLQPGNVDMSEGGEQSTDDVLVLLQLLRRAWKKEYFTSALPSPQRGPEVKINMFDGQTLSATGEGIDFEIKANNMGDQDNVDPDEYIFTRDPMGGVNPHSSSMYINGTSQGDPHMFDTSLNIKGDNLKVDMSGLSPMAITAFRNLFKLQAFLEKNNVGGGRFIETILAQWGERVPDFTVQRPQFIRATSIPVQITEVLATANTQGVNSVVGDQAGHARTQGNLGKISIYTHEPSIIIGLYCVGIPPVYAGQGIPKIFQRVTRFDEPWTDFQHIGEQNIKTRELYFPFDDSTKSDKDFGYQQRFSEFKYMPDRVVGDFTTSLSYWHMARMFSSFPYLNENFVMQHPDERIFAVKNEKPVIASFYFDCVAKRKLSKFSTPKLN